MSLAAGHKIISDTKRYEIFVRAQEGCPITEASQSLSTIQSGFILQSSVTGVSIFLSLWEPVDSSNEMLKS